MKSGLARQYSSLLEFILRSSDVALIALSGLLAYYMRFGDFALSTEYRIAVFISGPALLYIFQSFGLYTTWRGLGIFDEVKKAFLATVAVFVALSMITVMLQATNDYSRIWAGIWFLNTIGSVIVARFILRTILHEMRRRGFNTRTVLVVGSADQIARAERIVAKAPQLGLNIAGYVPIDRLSYSEVQSDKLGEVGQMESILENHYIDQVWLVTTFEQSALAHVILQKLKQSPVAIRWLPDFLDFQLLNHSISQVDGHPMLNLSDTPIQGISRVSKWIEDKVLALAILIIIAPVMLVIAAAIKLTSKGPVLFKQERHGEKGEIIQVYKFRSMYVHDEGTAVTQAKKGDARITPLGAFMRKTSLDELPQFINVLKGDMSIVGPRPHALVHNHQYKATIDSYMRRHGVKPGITGWAQVNGLRGETDTLDKMERRVDADMYYINNWSVWLDLKIIMLTVIRGFTGGNAY